MSFQSEMAAYQFEVEQLAATYIRDGIAGPWRALELARETVKRRRQEKMQKHALGALQRTEESHE